MSTFDELRQILIPPDEPELCGTAQEWDAFEARVGVSLPSDYRAFVETYGHGTPNGDFWVLNPFNGSFESGQASFREVYKELYSTQDYFAYIAEGLSEPVPATLIAWASGDSANSYWDTRAGDPDQWTILEERENYWQRFPFTVSEFLVKAITGQIDSIVYGESPRKLPIPFQRFNGRG